jgi:hypothetical protein
MGQSQGPQDMRTIHAVINGKTPEQDQWIEESVEADTTWRSS